MHPATKLCPLHWYSTGVGSPLAVRVEWLPRSNSIPVRQSSSLHVPGMTSCVSGSSRSASLVVPVGNLVLSMLWMTHAAKTIASTFLVFCAIWARWNRNLKDYQVKHKCGTNWRNVAGTTVTSLTPDIY